MLDIGLTLVRMTFIAVFMAVALEQIFDTKLYQKYLGKGLNGEGSKFFQMFELRPWLSSALGIFIAFSFNITALESGLGSEFMSETGYDAQILDMILTGLIIGGGTKTIKKLANNFYSAQKDIIG